MNATVYLVGAGPGDPQLITLKGHRLLQMADVVLYDRLAHPDLLKNLRAELIYVGKSAADHRIPQPEIATLMISKAREGKLVVRLKGGDPLLFAHASEELEALFAAGIAFEIVPGVTSLTGLAAYSGVPLTHKKISDSVALITGHDPDAIDWAGLKGVSTLALFMVGQQFGLISARLIDAGWPRSTPVVVISSGTRPTQRVLEGTLEKLDYQDLPAPTMFLVGEVVALRGRFNWFEKLPLFGQRIIITRDRAQAPELAERFTALGAEVIECPVIEIQPLDFIVPNLDPYDWTIFTSANGVRHFLDRLTDIRQLKGRIAAVGASTKATIESYRLKVDRVPTEYVAEGIVEAFAQDDLRGQRILMPRASVARDVVPDELKKLGAVVDVLDVYRNVVPDDAPRRAAEAFQTKPDWVTFTSSSTVKNLLAVMDRSKLAGVRLASIGPVTSDTLRKHGLSVDAEASPHTMDALVDAIIQHAANSSSN